MLRFHSKILAFLTAHALLWQCGIGQSRSVTPKPAAELAALEEQVGKEFNAARKASGQKPLAFRKDIRVRMESCSVAQKGVDHIVQPGDGSRKYWYITQDPKAPVPEIKEFSTMVTPYGSVGVGVWYATSEQYPAGAYWVVIYPEHSAAHEAFWGHFYLTDSFQYITPFDKYWKKKLPSQCRNLK